MYCVNRMPAVSNSNWILRFMFRYAYHRTQSDQFTTSFRSVAIILRSRTNDSPSGDSTSRNSL